MADETAIALPEEVRTPLNKLAQVSSWIFAIAAVDFALLMALSTRYGFHADELYFLDCARHLSLSYVDQPILVPLLARISLDLFGVSLIGLRVWPALAAFATIVVGGLTARELGGGKTAQILTALGVATSPAILMLDHFLDTSPIDILAWSTLALVMIRIDRTGNTRLWIPAGLIVGIGLTNKHLIGFFALAVVIGILLSGGRHFMTNRFFVIGALIAFAFTIPEIWWQAQHGWATLTMTRNLSRESGGIRGTLVFIVTQPFLTQVTLIGVCLFGLRFLWQSERPLRRALAWAYGLLFVAFALTTGEKGYYLTAPYIYLLAAGTVVMERRWAHVSTRTRKLVLIGIGITQNLAISLVIGLPILPARLAGWTSWASNAQVNMIGWPQLAGTVAGVWNRLPSAERADAVIFTANYAEAGAINELGRSYHLPEAVSGHNNEWWWGPGNPHASTVLAVAPGNEAAQWLATLRSDFAHVQVAVAMSATPPNGNLGGFVYICTGPVRSWGSLWPSLRHYN